MRRGADEDGAEDAAEEDGEEGETRGGRGPVAFEDERVGIGEEEDVH